MLTIPGGPERGQIRLACRLSASGARFTANTTLPLSRLTVRLATMAARPGDSRLYSMLILVALSAVIGVFVAGMGLPFAAVASNAAGSASDSLDDVTTQLTIPHQAEKSEVLLANGESLASFFDQNRQPVSLDEISPAMQKAQLAIEDHRFYEHGAVDAQGILRAAVGQLAGESGGGSTLTQQYVKQVRIQIAQDNGDTEAEAEAQAPTLSRKILEMRYAVALEAELTQEKGSLKAAKDTILENYLNIAYYGDGAYGVQAAAKHYFGIDAKDLDVTQSAMLAGLVQNPSTTDPVNYTDAAIARRNVVLDAMLKWDQEDDWFSGTAELTQEDVDAAKATDFDQSKVTENYSGCASSRYPFICQYVENTLLSDDMTSLGNDRESRERALYRGGLKIQTVIEPDAQDAAQNAISALVSPTDPVVSVAVMTDPKTGLIKSMAQSKPVMGTNSAAGETYYNYAVSQDMGGAEGYQAGSTFKAFVAAAAIAQGFIPDKTYYNAPSTKNWEGTTFKDCQGDFKYSSGDSKGWTVSNSWKTGNMNMLTGMGASVNNYFVALERDAGICSSIQMAETVGMKLADPNLDMLSYQNVPSFTLGALNVTPLSMAEAYATFANRGIHCDPVILADAKTADGNELAVPSANCTQVIDPNVADGMNLVMQQVMKTGGTGVASKVSGDYDQAGKTGTAGSTETESAVWFNAYTPELEGVAMVSVDPGNSYWSGRTQTLTGLTTGSGRTLSGNSTTESGGIWKAMMEAELPKTTATKFHGYTAPSTTQPAAYKGG